MDKSKSQAALLQVSSPLLNSDSRMRVTCENIFCASWWQITSHNDTPSCHDDTHLKSIENSEAAMTQPAKKFHTKRFCTSGRNATFVVLFRFLFTMIIYRKWCLILAMFEKESWWQFVQCVIYTRAPKIISCSWFHNCDVFNWSMVSQ